MARNFSLAASRLVIAVSLLLAGAMGVIEFFSGYELGISPL